MAGGSLDALSEIPSVESPDPAAFRIVKEGKIVLSAVEDPVAVMKLEDAVRGEGTDIGRPERGIIVCVSYKTAFKRCKTDAAIA